jgi:hypothetical protein
MMQVVKVDAEPEPIGIDVDHTAVVVIDMQRDFLQPGGFGEALGNDVSLLSAAIAPIKALLEGARKRKMLIIHTREGHRPDMSDAPPAKVERGSPHLRIGAKGPMGRILIRGEPGHDIVPELYPREGEPIVDKPGKGAFYATDSAPDSSGSSRAEPHRLRSDDRGLRPHYRARSQRSRLQLHRSGDCCGSYFPEFHEVGLRMIKAQGGIFGWVSDSAKVLKAIA